MIGQQNIKKQLTESKAQFILICGSMGSGRKTLIREVFSDAIFMPDIKVDTIRNMIRMLNKQRNGIFVITDADDMSMAGKNALLKVTEECPNNNRIIITVESKSSMPDTIISRAAVLNMDQYLPSQLFNYYWSLEGSNLMPHGMPNDAEIIQDLCETPGEVELFIKNGIQQLMDYVHLVIDNIATVSGANAFKVASKVALKDGDTGFDLKLFWKVFMKVCADSDMLSGIHKADAIIITRRNLQALGIRGINRQFLMDMWILDIREAWFVEERYGA